MAKSKPKPPPTTGSISPTSVSTGADVSDAVAARAQRATRQFRRMMPQMQGFARVLTNRNDMKVIPTPGVPCTDGNVIYLNVPIELGDVIQHDRAMCDTRDPDTELQVCGACAAREEVIITLFHEMAHIIFDSFGELEPSDKVEILGRVLAERSIDDTSSRAAKIKWALDQIDPNSYVAASNLISPFLGNIVNALEDVRVNRQMYAARPGTRVMFRASSSRIFRDGIDNGEEIVEWRNLPVNAQAIVSLYAYCAGYDWQGWFAPEVEQMLADPELEKLLHRMDTVRSVRGVYELAIPVLERIRELGFCLHPDDIEADPEPDPEPDDTDTDGDDDNESDDIDPGDEQDADDSSDDEPEPEQDADDAEQGSEQDDDDFDGSESDDDGADGTEPAEQDAEPATEQDAEQGGEQDDAEPEQDDDAEQGATEPAQDDAEPEPADDGAEPEQGATGEQDGAQDDDAEPEQGGEQDAEPADDGAEPEQGGEQDDDSDPYDDDDFDPYDDIDDDDWDADESDQADDSSCDDGDAEQDGDADEQGDDVESDDDSPGDGADATEQGDPGDSGDGADDEPTDDDGAEQDAPGSSSGMTLDGDDAEQDADAAQTDSESGDGDGNGQGAGQSAPSPGMSQDDDWTDHLDDEPSDSSQPAQPGPGDDDIETNGDQDLADKALRVFGGHAEPDDEPNREEQDADEQDDPVEGECSAGDGEHAVAVALVQGEYFDQPSKSIYGVRIHEYGNPIFLVEDGYRINTSDAVDPNASNAWGAWYVVPELSTDRHRTMVEVARRRHCVDTQYETTPESFLSRPLLEMRTAFAKNRRADMRRNLKSGSRIDSKIGRRAPTGDPRIFAKKTRPGKREYYVVIGMDVSGSQATGTMEPTKRAVLAQAEMCHRLGVRFAIMGHTAMPASATQGPRGSGMDGYGAMYDLDIYMVKADNEPWDVHTRRRLMDIGPSGGNLDGHTLEFYRKYIERQQATDKIIMYYTDGEMPMSNYYEERDILEREVQHCKNRGIHLMGVGMGTDSPKQYGLDTVQFDDERDLAAVVRHLGKILNP